MTPFLQRVALYVRTTGAGRRSPTAVLPFIALPGRVDDDSGVQIFTIEN